MGHFLVKNIQSILISTLLSIIIINGKTWNILNEGIIASHDDISTCNNNTKILNSLLNNQLQSGDTILIPKSNQFWFNGGINSSNLNNITIQIDGTINFQNERKYWPTYPNSTKVLEAILMTDCSNLIFTSSNGASMKALIDGHGSKWYGAINYCNYRENRPRLLHIINSKNILIEYLYFKDSPYWTVYLEDVKNVEIHNTNISASRDKKDYHSYYDITAFNTDGFDISGENIYIHDCQIWNDDDCIAVKPQSQTSKMSNCSRNMLFERINASGLGLTIGSVSASNGHCVDNITFRDAYMLNTYKGIYMKSAPGNGHGIISNVLYENITMDKPEQYAIWIGPQQAIYHNQCSLFWPEDPFAKCPVTKGIDWVNITLRNIVINEPKHSPGTIIGNETNPIKNIIFDNVIVNKPGYRPWKDEYYKCDGVDEFKAIHGTNPVPKCSSSTELVNNHWNETLEAIPGYHKMKELLECLESKL